MKFGHVRPDWQQMHFETEHWTLRSVYIAHEVSKPLHILFDARRQFRASIVRRLETSTGMQTKLFLLMPLWEYLNKNSLNTRTRLGHRMSTRLRWEKKFGHVKPDWPQMHYESQYWSLRQVQSRSEPLHIPFDALREFRAPIWISFEIQSVITTLFGLVTAFLKVATGLCMYDA